MSLQIQLMIALQLSQIHLFLDVEIENDLSLMQHLLHHPHDYYRSSITYQTEITTVAIYSI